MLGSSTPPITSPHASPATATRNPSPRRTGLRLHRSPQPPRIDHPRLPDSAPRKGLKFQIFLASFRNAAAVAGALDRQISPFAALSRRDLDLVVASGAVDHVGDHPGKNE